MYKILLACCFAFLIFPLSAVSASAAIATSNCVITNIGDPGNQPLPANCSVRKKVVYYCQNDYSYCNISFSGCGPTSFAMILSTFGITTTPPQAADLFRDVGARACGDGSVIPIAFSKLLPSRGFTYLQILQNPPVGVSNATVPRPSLNLTTAKNYLDQGYLILGSTEGHIFVVDDVDIAKDSVHMQDPAGPGCRTREQGGYWSPNNFPWLGNSWYYAYVVKKTS